MGLFELFNPKRSLIESGVLKGSTDRHSHILFGVDDGISIPDDSLKVLKFQESRILSNESALLTVPQE